MGSLQDVALPLECRVININGNEVRDFYVWTESYFN